MSLGANGDLRGAGILITRAFHQSERLNSLIEKRGGIPYLAPTIKITAPSSFDEVDSALRRVGSFDYLIFTSSNGVERFVHRAQDLKVDLKSKLNASIAVVGRRTELKLNEHGMTSDLIPEEFNSKSMLLLLSGLNIGGKEILFPGAEIGRDFLVNGLKDLGAEVSPVPVYKTVANTDIDISRLKEVLSLGLIDVASFTSPSTFRCLLELAGREILNRAVENGTRIAAIGRVTAEAIEAEGFSVRIVPEVSTDESLVDAICESLKTGEGNRNITNSVEAAGK